MTKAEIITEMESKGAVNVKDMGFDGNLDYNENEIHPIKYRRDLGADEQSEPETLYLIKQTDDSFVYEKGKPNWMKDSSTVTPQRDFILTVDEIVSKVEQHYISENNGTWNGEVYPDSVDRRLINSRDQIFVDIVNQQKKVEKRKEFIVSQADAPDWVQPTGAHDAYDEIGELVTHNGKVWENTHGTGNAWEPGGTDIADTIWKEVDAVKMRPVQ